MKIIIEYWRIFHNGQTQYDFDGDLLNPLAISAKESVLCKGSQTVRGSDTFAKYPQYRLQIPSRIIPPKGSPEELRFLGEHIRKLHLDPGVLQIEVAAQIGVTESTLWNWEHGTEPELIHVPAVLEFLGYVPWEVPEETVARLAHFKKVKGLSFERLGELMGRDPEQLSD